MTEWIKGRELLEPPYNLTWRRIFYAVRDGVLVPRDKNGWRIFPNNELEEKYRSLRILRGQLDEAKIKSLMSDDERIAIREFELHHGFVGLNRPSDLKSYIEIELPKFRRDESQQLKDLPPQIEKLEEELARNRIWEDLDLIPAEQESLREKLLDAWYALDEVEAFLGAASEKQSSRQANPSKQRLWSQNTREKVRAWAADLWGKKPGITLADMQGKIPRNIASKRNGDPYSEVTTRKWIKDLCPNRRPGRRRSQ